MLESATLLLLAALSTTPVQQAVVNDTAGGGGMKVTGLADAKRGAAIVTSRTLGLCTLCHAVPGVPNAFVGDLGPSLAGIGSRWKAEELRQRLLTPERYNPDTVMPSYGRTTGYWRLPAARAGKPLLDDQQMEDVVAYLLTLK